jgi:uncharacterized protein (DUF1778 family)
MSTTQKAKRGVRASDAAVEKQPETPSTKKNAARYDDAGGKAKGKKRTVKVAEPSTGILALSVPGMASEKEARIELRVEDSLKRLIERAAAMLGMSVSAYIVSTSVSDARRVINEESRTQLSLADWERFQNILSAPPPPTAALKKAAGRYRKTVTHSDGF